MLKTRNTKAALFVLLIACLASHSVSAQDKRPSNVVKTSKIVATADEKTAITISRDRERERFIKELVADLAVEARTILNPVIRARIRTVSANAFWHFHPETAREIVLEEFSALKSLKPLETTAKFWIEQDGKSNYKGMPLEQLKAELKRDLFASAGLNDPAFFRELLAQNKKSESSEATGSDQLTEQQLATAGDLAAVDPAASARLINDSLQKGIDGSFSFALVRLRETSPAVASQIFNQALRQAKTSGDLWQFQRLAPYILPSEMDRLVGGKLYLTDPQRMMDTKRMVEYGGEVLYRRIQSEAAANLPPDQARKEYYLWRNLQAIFADVDPNNLWLVNARLRQLSSTFPPSAQSSVGGPWSEDRLKTLLAAAEQSSGEKRDNYLSTAASATWRFGEGNLEKAIALVEKISDPHLRDDMAGILYFQAGTKYLRSEGPDYSLELARKINLPGPRTRLFLAIIGSLQSVKATERADSLRRELLNWLGNCERNSDTAWALLDYIDASISNVPEDRFAAFEILVRVLNSPGLEIKGGIKNRTYWYPEFHDFQKSLMPLVKADYERTLQLIYMLNSRETSMQIQAAFCADYLKLQTQNKSVTENRSNQ